MIYMFVVAVGGVGLVVYLVMVYGALPGAAEQRFGKLEPLPPDIGIWKVDRESVAGQAALARGQLRETRVWHTPATGLFTKERLVRQARVRNAETDVIEHVLPEEPVVRRRLR